VKAGVTLGGSDRGARGRIIDAGDGVSPLTEVVVHKAGRGEEGCS
jgi:hypothetical protein